MVQCSVQMANCSAEHCHTDITTRANFKVYGLVPCASGSPASIKGVLCWCLPCPVTATNKVVKRRLEQHTYKCKTLQLTDAGATCAGKDMKQHLSPGALQSNDQ
uniref:Uncharacterized protein n=1 Tax=Pyxicephalus adspersus TaxID=30357 RepID=A0AAV3A7Y1_PYXAD|nr:TPA: hypothetical protein GDO54_015375 [Pyxicephalus adspersus]